MGTLILAACGAASTTTSGPSIVSAYNPQKGTQGGQLVFSDWESVDDLGILITSAATTVQVGSGPIWSALWVFDGQSKPIPDLVSEIPTSDNGDVKKIDSTHMDVTIKLRKGLKWSDGSPLTTADVDFTLRAICDPSLGASSTTGFDHISSTTIQDAQTMVWHFGPNKAGTCGLSSDLQSGIYAPYLLLGTNPMNPMPKAVLGSIPFKDWATADYFTKKPTVTSGPYMVQNFTPGPAAIVTLVPNPNYAAGRSDSKFLNHAPYLNKLTYKIYGDKSSQIAGIKSGDTDLGVDLIANDLRSLTNIPNGKAIYANGLLNEFLNLNQGNNTTGCDAQKFAATCGKPTPWKDDKVLRQAINLAIDKDAMNAQLVGGIGKAMNGPFPSSLQPYFDSSIPKFKRDVDKANSLLDSDGWVKGPDGTRSKNGQKLAWVLSTTAGNPQRAAEEELLIHNWKDIGATVTTKNFQAGKFFTGFKNGGINATGQFDMSLYANNWDPDPDGWARTALSSLMPSSSFPSGRNWNRVNDPKLDQLFAAGANEVDISKRIGIYKDAQTEWRDYLPTIDLYERPDVFAVSNAFGNFFPAVNTCLSTCNTADWFRKGAS